MGNKSDLNNFRTVSTDEGISLVEKWGKGCKWKEVSAKYDDGITSTFKEIIPMIEKKRDMEKQRTQNINILKKKSKKCVIQ